ncbi:MAG: hypothetical protein ACK58T_21340 [Phycisphaerae bacterium]
MVRSVRRGSARLMRAGFLLRTAPVARLRAAADWWHLQSDTFRAVHAIDKHAILLPDATLEGIHADRADGGHRGGRGADIAAGAWAEDGAAAGV